MSAGLGWARPREVYDEVDKIRQGHKFFGKWKVMFIDCWCWEPYLFNLAVTTVQRDV